MATGVASPFFAAHMIKNLRMSFSQIAIYSILAGVMNLVTLPFWGKVIDRVGNRPVLAWNVGAVVTLPLLWLFATPSFLLPIWIDAILTGLFWPGLTLATFNLVLATAPEENRTAYLGMQAAAVGVFTFASSLLGGVLAKALDDFHATVGPTALPNFHLLYILSAVLRLAILPLVFHLREERAQTVAALLDLVGDKVSQRFHEGLQSGVAILRKMGGNGKIGGNGEG
ncbi:MAG: MFS transporter [Candidatus Eisenbacteria bacterium]|nr:MFS transporter [Candidatus Eisenbacteria bacterium]